VLFDHDVILIVPYTRDRDTELFFREQVSKGSSNFLEAIPNYVAAATFHLEKRQKFSRQK
jgi:hypothetical protein